MLYGITNQHKGHQEKMTRWTPSTGLCYLIYIKRSALPPLIIKEDNQHEKSKV